MYLFDLAFINALHRKLQTALSAVGIVAEIVAFGLLHTIVDTGGRPSRLG